MTYGIEILNQYGERALDFTQVFYIHQKDICTKWTPWYANNAFVGSPGGNPPLDAYMVGPWWTNFWYPSKGLLLNRVSGTNFGFILDFRSEDDGSFVSQVVQTAGAPTTETLRTDNGALTEVPDVIEDFDTELFFGLPPEGLTAFGTIIQKYGNFGSKGTGVMGYAQPYHTFSGRLDYLIARPSEPTTPPAENYAMQLFDSSGGKVFDSRYETLSIVDHIYIPKSDMSDVLVNGSVYTYDLRVTVTNPFVSSGNFDSVYIDTRPIYEKHYVPRLRVTNAGNTLELSRARYVGSQTSTGFVFNGASESEIMIADVL